MKLSTKIPLFESVTPTALKKEEILLLSLLKEKLGAIPTQTSSDKTNKTWQFRAGIKNFGISSNGRIIEISSSESGRFVRYNGYEILVGAKTIIGSISTNQYKLPRKASDHMGALVQAFQLEVMSWKPVLNENKQEMFQPPSGAAGNAKQVLKWKEEHGDEVKGMTQVGWTRARQLASGDKVSRDIVGRMASFARHKKNAEVSSENKNTPWKDAGYVAWLGWGGDTGINWAKEIIDNEKS